MKRALPAFFLCLLVTSLAAQRGSSRKSSGTGVACGNSYISAGKTCHVGALAPQPRDSTAARQLDSLERADSLPPVTAADSARHARVLAYRAATRPATAAQARPDSIPLHSKFVSYRESRFFYTMACPFVAEMPDLGRVYFKSEIDAIVSGRIASTLPGC